MLCFLTFFSVFKPDKVKQGFPKVRAESLRRGDCFQPNVFFFLNQENWFSSSVRACFIYLCTINTCYTINGCHLRIRNCLKLLASAEFKWRSTILLLAQYMWHCRWGLPGLQALITFSFFVYLCMWPWKYTIQGHTLRWQWHFWTLWENIHHQ